VTAVGASAIRTVALRRLALEAAEALGTDPDALGYDVPRRRVACERLTL
jgi:hypothetical protein